MAGEYLLTRVCVSDSRVVSASPIIYAFDVDIET